MRGRTSLIRPSVASLPVTFPPDHPTLMAGIGALAEGVDHPPPAPAAPNDVRVWVNSSRASSVRSRWSPETISMPYMFLAGESVASAAQRADGSPLSVRSCSKSRSEETKQWRQRATSSGVSRPGVLDELVSAHKPLRRGLTKRATLELIGKGQCAEWQRPDVGECLANTVIEKRR